MKILFIGSQWIPATRTRAGKVAPVAYLASILSATVALHGVGQHVNICVTFQLMELALWIKVC